MSIKYSMRSGFALWANLRMGLFITITRKERKPVKPNPFIGMTHIFGLKYHIIITPCVILTIFPSLIAIFYLVFFSISFGISECLCVCSSGCIYSIFIPFNFLFFLLNILLSGMTIYTLLLHPLSM